MKISKTITMFLIAGIVLLGLGVVLYSGMAELKTSDYVIFSGILLMVIFAVQMAVKRLKSEKKGFPGEDELSKKIKEKAAAKAYLGSLYFWALLLLFFIDKDMDIEVILGIGIVAMGLIFFGYWAYYNIKGISNENKD